MPIQQHRQSLGKKPFKQAAVVCTCAAIGAATFTAPVTRGAPRSTASATVDRAAPSHPSATTPPPQRPTVIAVPILPSQQRPTTPLPPRESLMDQVDREVDRGAGRVRSDINFDVDHWRKDLDAQLGLRQPQTDLQRFWEDNDRRTEIERIARLNAVLKPTPTPAKKVRPTSPSDTSATLIHPHPQDARPNPVDEALADAAAQRDRDLAAASADHQHALQDLTARHLPPAQDRALRGPLENAYRLRKTALQDAYGHRRAELLGLWQGN